MVVRLLSIVRAPFRAVESIHSLSTLDFVKDSSLHLLLLEACLLDGYVSPASSQRCGEQRQVCAGVILPPWWKRIKLVERRKWLKKTQLKGIELQETHAQRVPQRRRRIHGGESELRETNPCVSFVVCLTTHFSSY